MRVLGIETSCDDTSIAILDEYRLISMNTHHQLIHRKYGGVMPEVASREHVRYIHELVLMTLEDANLSMQDIDGIAVTFAPGLAGSLLVGINFAKGLAQRYNKQFIGVHHLEGHIASNYIENNNWEPPFICLLASGGHTQLVHVKSLFEFELLGTSIDDAVGEAFDKTAKMMDLPYPGGPIIDNLAQSGNSDFIDFPIPYIKNENMNFSYSGLKTAVLNYLRSYPDYDKNDVCASFQKVAIKALMIKIDRAIKHTKLNRIAIAGGVSANSVLRMELKKLEDSDIDINLPALKFCTDNGAMIAMAGLLRMKHQFTSGFDLEMKPILPLDEMTYESISV